MKTPNASLSLLIFKVSVFCMFLVGGLPNLQAQNYYIDYKIRTDDFYANVDNEAPYISSDEEVTWRIRHKFYYEDETTSEWVCFSKDANFNNDHWWNRDTEVIFEGKYWQNDELVVHLEAWEDDGGDRCSYDSGDDDYAIYDDEDYNLNISLNYGSYRGQWCDYKNPKYDDVDYAYCSSDGCSYRVELDIYWDYSLPVEPSFKVENGASNTFVITKTNNNKYKINFWDYQVSTDQDFTTIVQSGTEISESSVTIEVLDENTLYYFRIRGENEVGVGEYTTPIVYRYNAFPSGGFGTPAVPYVINNLEDLYFLADNNTYWDKYFIQTADIDASISSGWKYGKGFKPIGNLGTNFTGSYNGDHYTIENLNCYRPGDDYLGLFGYIDQATLQNICVVNATITGNYYLGGLVGYVKNSTEIAQSSSSGTISGSKYLGGLVGIADGTTISDCYARVNIESSFSSFVYLGAFVGYATSSQISNSYATGSTTYNSGTNATQCGFLGYYSISNTTSGNFFDSEASGQTTGEGATGLLTEEMQVDNNFIDAGWDFKGESTNGLDETWDISAGENDGYPILYGIASYSSIFDGEGTVENPYQIQDLNDLYYLSISDAIWDKHFLQTADIDAAETSGWNDGAGYSPIGNSTTNFSGSVDGGGYSITNLTIYRPSESYMGLFGYTNGATLQDIHIVDATISGNYYLGGLVGYADTSTEITQSSSSGTISGNDYLGGLVGRTSEATVSDCYARVNIESSYGIYIYLGAFIGNATNSQISNNYATGSTTYNSGTNATQCGFLGIWSDANTTSGNFFDSEASGQTTGEGATGLVTAQMQVDYYYIDAGWDFEGESTNGADDIWNISSDDNDGYPNLIGISSNLSNFDGEGTLENPYLITCLQDLYNLTLFDVLWEQHFLQTADIDAAATSGWNDWAGFSPIGNSTTNFSGSYDGGGYSIANLTIYRPSEDYQGLFGYTNGATLQDIHIMDATISGNYYLGGLVGYADNSTGITRSSSSGTLSGEYSLGGLVGYADNSTGITQSSSSGTIEGDDYLGGLVGFTYNTFVSNSYACVNIESSNMSYSYLGAFIGKAEASFIFMSYATGSTTYNSGANATQCGFLGIWSDANTTSGNFFDGEASGQITGEGATGLLTAQMQTQSSFSGWDFVGETLDDDDIWAIASDYNDGYPNLEGVSETLSWTGAVSSIWNNTSNWENNTVPHYANAVVIPSTVHDPLIGTGETANCANLTVDANATLTVESQGSFISTGNITNNGTITMQIDPTGNYGWQMISASAEVDISDNDWSPSDENDFYMWHEASPGTWVNYKNTASFQALNVGDNFVAGRGYLLAFQESSVSKSFTGTPNTGEVAITLQNTGSVKSQNDWSYTNGCNLIGNPYPSYIDWNLADRSLFQDNYVYVYDCGKEGGEGYVAIDGDAAEALIPPHQGFFVLATEVANDQDFTFTNNLRTHLVTTKKELENQQVVVRLSDTFYYDEATIGQHDESQNTRDRHDAIKMFSYKTAMPQLYSFTPEAVPLAVNRKPNLADGQAIALGMVLEEQQNYEVSLSENVENKTVYLEDKEKEIIQNLTEETYAFTAQDTEIADRFYLYFEDPRDESNQNPLTIWQQDDKLYVTGVDFTGYDQIRLLDVQGRIVKQYAITAEEILTITGPKVSGVYVIQLQGSDKVINQKTVVTAR